MSKVELASVAYDVLAFGDPNGERLPLHEVVRVPRLKDCPRMAAKCHDCAFAAGGSPEQKDWNTWGNILAHVDRGEPFFCHQGMPTDEIGKYAPALDASGFPSNGRICAGWVEMRARFMDTQHRDLVEGMRGAPVDYPLTFAVALAATRAVAR